MIFIVLISIGLWYFVFVYGEYSTFKSESASLHVRYLKSQKLMLQGQVTNAVDFINDLKKLAERQLKTIVRERVDTACATAMNIYKQNAGIKSIPEIENMIKDALYSVKISFVKGIPQWNWIIGAGVYLDTIDKIIGEKRADLNNKFKQNLIRGIFVTLLLLCLVFFWSKRFGNQIFESIEIINFVAVKRDITDNIMMEKKLQQSQKMESIGILAGGIAHDFNNILFPITGYIEMMMQDADEDEDNPWKDSLSALLLNFCQKKQEIGVGHMGCGFPALD